MPRRVVTAVLSTLALVGCSPKPDPSTAPSAQTATQDTSSAEQDVNQKLVTLLDAQWEERVALSPEYQTNLGRKTNYDQWTDRSEAAADRRRQLIENQLAALKDGFKRDELSPDGKLNYDLAIYTYNNELALDEFRAQRYPISQFRGIHSYIPVFLANFHKIDSVEDAHAYIERVKTVDQPLGQVAGQIEQQAKAGYPLPAFSYPLIVGSARNAINGAPITKGADLPILTDFSKKVAALDLDEEAQATLLEELKQALSGPYAAAYDAFASRIDAVGSSDAISGNYGIGVRENGAPFYDALLASYTTTDMTADEIHALGLSEVARIHDEMRDIMTKVGFEGTLAEFFDFMRVDDQFFLPNTDEGREEYLALAQSYVDGIKLRLPELFITLPKADLVVRRVEPFRERSAGKAFYNQPSEDGTRPGIFYANLADMRQMPTYQLEALVYHEGIPGHHMQRSIQIEMTGLPKFRQFGGYTAFTEGWGLYSEFVPKEIGFYQDPYSDFGRLAMELWRAARLVVDTGLHAKGWEMQEAIDYLTENTPNPEGDCIKAIERYIVLPGQATSYKIGMLKILELRGKAQTALGDDFELAAFHDLLLTGGPLPLSVLEQRVDAFIEEKGGSAD